MFILMLGRWAGYFLLIIMSAWTDWKSRKIPNSLTYSAAGIGLALAAAESGLLALEGVSAVDAGWPLINSLLGGGFGFALMFFLFLRNGVGGGDVKLSAAAGLLVGLTHVMAVLLYACLVGVAMGLAMAIWNGRGSLVFRRMFSWKELTANRPPEESMQPVPFGIAFAGGALWAALLPVL